MRIILEVLKYGPSVPLILGAVRCADKLAICKTVDILDCIYTLDPACTFGSTYESLCGPETLRFIRLFSRRILIASQTVAYWNGIEVE